MKFSPHHPLAWIEGRLAELDEQSLRRELATCSGADKTRLVVDGRELVNFGSNDYLGLAGDPRLVAAAAEAARREGWARGASPLITGHTSAHLQLERRLAEFEETAAALVFASGYAANLGIIPALAAEGDVVYADQLNHASMIDGCRLSRARIEIYPHGDWRSLERMLSANHEGGRRLIATESIFSMDGDAAPLVELAELAARHDCLLLVDEAHATGVFGPSGRGLAEELGVERGVHVRIGTLSKALASAGGFVAGSEALIDWLVNRARTYVFSTALPPAACAAAMAALDIVHEEPWRRTALRKQARQLTESLSAEGWQVGATTSPIIPIVLGDARATLELAARLRDRGVLIPAIRPPTIAPGQSRLRVSLTCAHTAEMIHQFSLALISEKFS